MQGLPAACFVDAASAAAERHRIFDRSWQFVCHASDLPAAGTAIRFDCHGRSFVVLRGKDGKLHGFLNVCRHRGSRLIDGDAHTGLAFCVDARMRCPYHGWTYDETGALTSLGAGTISAGESSTAGGSSNRDGERHAASEQTTSGTSLQPVRVQEWLGLVFLAYEAPALSLAESLGELAPLRDPTATPGLRRLSEPHLHAVHADWKLACEHLLDVSHHGIARPALKPRLFAPAPFTASGPATTRAVAALEDSSDSPWWPARAYARFLPADAQRSLETVFLWPNLLLQFMPDQLRVVQVLPGPTGACTVREVSYGAPDASRELRLARYAASRVHRRARVQDIRILERVQAGLSSSEPDSRGSITADESGPRWFADRLHEAGIEVTSAKLMRSRRPHTASEAVAPAKGS